MACRYCIYLLYITLAIFIAGCSEDDGSSGSGGPYYFDPDIPEELPSATFKPEISWGGNISNHNLGTIEIHNELTGELTSAQIYSQDTCYSVIWIVVLIPADYCLTDYSYLAIVPLDVGINMLTVTATDSGGRVVATKSYSIVRYDLIPIYEQEPNDEYIEANEIVVPTIISGDLISANHDNDDIFLLTAEEGREYAIDMSCAGGYPLFSVFNFDLGFVASSDRAFLKVQLKAGEQVYIKVQSCLNDSYLLGVY